MIEALVTKPRRLCFAALAVICGCYVLMMLPPCVHRLAYAFTFSLIACAWPARRRLALPPADPMLPPPRLRLRPRPTSLLGEFIHDSRDTESEVNSNNSGGRAEISKHKHEEINNQEFFQLISHREGHWMLIKTRV